MAVLRPRARRLAETSTGLSRGRRQEAQGGGSSRPEAHLEPARGIEPPTS